MKNIKKFYRPDPAEHVLASAVFTLLSAVFAAVSVVAAVPAKVRMGWMTLDCAKQIAAVPGGAGQLVAYCATAAGIAFATALKAAVFGAIAPPPPPPPPPAVHPKAPVIAVKIAAMTG